MVGAVTLTVACTVMLLVRDCATNEFIKRAPHPERCVLIRAVHIGLVMFVYVVAFLAMLSLMLRTALVATEYYAAAVVLMSVMWMSWSFYGNRCVLTLMFNECAGILRSYEFRNIWQIVLNRRQTIAPLPSKVCTKALFVAIGFLLLAAPKQRQ